MPSKTATTRIAAAFRDYESFKSDIKEMEDEVTQIRTVRDELLKTAAREITDLAAQEIVDHDEQIYKLENEISRYEFEMEKVTTYLESVFNKIGIDKAIRIVSISNENVVIYRNDKNKFSTEKEPKSIL
ncbi:hypothetical protein [Niabella beijingensis]|uniref:hypothetical protein n=1 Tax=Niabella beijingensis TaxID=2872700 RepID=UPI001CC0D4D1|nr:hypothetical protein [Niabella beijingensis]MBZ4192590.1 hypothetical protein [Niabella beijingensis]